MSGERDNALVVGMGQVGTALARVLGDAHKVVCIDTERPVLESQFDVMHVCFPYRDGFEQDVENLRLRYTPTVAVIHSTVPVGTCGELGVVHSPVIGLHPNLEQSIRTFTKFIGGPEPDRSIAARHMHRAGIRCYLADDSYATELMKLLSTTFYGLLIEWTKHVAEECADIDVPFELWTLWTKAYNEGYQALGRPEFTRPELIPVSGRIGGHCVLPNLDLLNGDPFARLIRERQG